ncbi:MAG: hypothetical protein J6N21_06515, partial [Butyrivibrio sp.]|nr:hypothetical protein [Butyrivibrio sp.]
DPNDTAHNVNFTNEYTPDFTESINERTAILTNAGDKTDNTIAWQKYEGQPNYGKQVINITEKGTYFIDGSVPGNSDGRIYVSTSEKVNIILYNYNTDTNGNKYVTIPIVTNSSDYQTVQTDHDKPASWEIKPNITFVTEGTDVRIELQGENNIGNVLAPQQTVHLNDGNFCGTIICDTISGVAEGHKNDAGITAYYVDRRRVTTGDIISYVVTADEVTTKYSVSGEKDFFSARVTGYKEGYKPYLSAEKNVNLQDVKVTEYKVTADTMSKTKRLIAKRDVTTTIKKATLTKTDYSKTKTSFDRTYAIKIRRYSKNSERATWTETTTKVIPSETPETPPETPETPDTPVTPDVVPTPDENPTVPVIIIDDDTPLAAEVAQVLGARRVSAAQPMVLGARRGKTGDSTSNPLMATLMIMGASATAMGVLSSKKKKK